jgi:hypothetical protein
MALATARSGRHRAGGSTRKDPRVMIITADCHETADQQHARFAQVLLRLQLAGEHGVFTQHTAAQRPAGALVKRLCHRV